MRVKLGCLVVVVFVGCGTEASPVEKCDDLVDVICDRGVQCVGGTHVECVQAVQTQLACGGVKAVSASYDRCIDQLQAAGCASLFPIDAQTNQPELQLPADCRGVVLSRTTASTMSPLAIPQASITSP